MKYLGRILVMAALLAGIAVAASHREALDAQALEQWVAGFGVWAPLVFVALYALATVLFLPGSVLTIAGGIIFGPWWGVLWNLTGATIGATIAFLASRYLASDWVARKAGGKLGQILAGVEQEGWRFVAFVRLVPLFPFNLLNYALGLTRIHLGSYVLASAVCMLPGCLAYTYLGYLGREAAGGGGDLIKKAALAVSLLAAAALLPALARRFRKGPERSPVEEPKP